MNLYCSQPRSSPTLNPESAPVHQQTFREFCREDLPTTLLYLGWIILLTIIQANGGLK